jgi:hypothetical protein
VATRTKCAGHHQHYGTDNTIVNNIYYHVNIGDQPTPGRAQILMPGQCDGAIRASTHHRDPATCHPDTHPTASCCCHPGCDQGKCSSFTFERNIVFQPVDAAGKLVATTFFAGLDNFSFTNNLYYAGNTSTTVPLFNATGKTAEGFAKWQAHGKDEGSKIADPKFESASKFTLASDSPAIKLGFVPISISHVGPLPDDRNALVGSARCAHVPSRVTSDTHFLDLAAAGLVR